MIAQRRNSRHTGLRDRVRELLDQQPAKASAVLAVTEEAPVTIPGLPPSLHVIGRCNRWGVYIRWLEHAGIFAAGPKPIRSWWGPIVLDGNVEQLARDRREACPVDAIECLETDRAVRRLPDNLPDVMLVEHVVRVPRTGKNGRSRYVEPTQQEKANLIKVSRTTYWRYCQSAHGMLLGLMNDIAAES